MTSPARHPDLDSLVFLLGTWKGEGRGEYPTIDDFTYHEEVTFSHVGKPFVAYHQKTANAAGAPMHTEFGYIRAVGADRVELILAQPTGVTEIHEGIVRDSSIELTAVDVGLSPTAKEVRSVRRRIEVDGDRLHYRLDMAAVGQPEQFHLEATLHRE